MRATTTTTGATTMTNPRPKESHLLLKGAMVVGSLAASLLGTRLLAQREAATAAQAVDPTPIFVTVYLPAPTAVPVSAANQAAPANHASSAAAQPVLSNLAPIPQAITPVIRPVAHTKSSK